MDHVAELLHTDVRPVALGRAARDRAGFGQQPSQLGKLIHAARPRETGVVARDFLQAQHVKIGQLARVIDDAAPIDQPIDPASPLDVPGDEVHGQWLS